MQYKAYDKNEGEWIFSDKCKSKDKALEGDWWFDKDTQSFKRYCTYDVYDASEFPKLHTEWQEIKATETY